ncbi:MAG: toll/interleukin-1 receptor domain-containing protein [Ruminococcus sp.]|nr:toll/interleukin-1 receptor domain-containing protein [Ruminococcus sp.]MBQ1897899.1 toll/interleukin-1 receptor domain-containing protein [Ruminococcus sp.]MBQ4238642.1 toll/interleukin-1 receptor domain-containing protein [Ruminococcus sp.]
MLGALNSRGVSVENLEVQKPLAFISYSSADKNIADNLCSKLEQNGVRVWYAPRNIDTADYASAIVKAITNCTHFIVIISHNSLQSQHVLNEIDLAFQELRRKILFYPLKLDSEEMGPAFRYYLSRQHWMDASCPPLEAQLDQFVGKIKAELDP